MSDQEHKARAFAALHVPGDPLLLFNAWDPGSARVVAEAGAKAIATGSWSVAAAFGFDDGEEMPRELALGNLARIVRAVALPVTIDLESGYGRAPEAVAETVRLAWAAGAIGCNLEDRVIGGSGLYPVEEQAERLRAARAAAPDMFINARTDPFLEADPSAHDDRLLDEALARGRAYAEAGANGLFVPGLGDERLIERLCRQAPLPVNIMAWHNTPPKPSTPDLPLPGREGRIQSPTTPPSFLVMTVVSAATPPNMVWRRE
jgi:2-methylisocitrate lyase-like PEP mutase family enzyme